MRSIFCLGLLPFLFVACTTPPAPESTEAQPAESEVKAAPKPLNYVPKWAQEAFWYQIFPERFRNGDPANDPSLHDMEGAWPYLQPEGWEVTPWGHDWYAQEEWAKKSGEGFYTTVQLRRYGGDLQGVLDRLIYLKDLGVTAIYFNPLNDSPSLHKYDARNYRHIDRNLGPNPKADEAQMATENPVDPNTWTWTEADNLFLKVIETCHKEGIRVIMDYSWNHTGSTFWAWQDVLANQQESAFANWYEIEVFDDPATEANEFAYSSWAGEKELPELKKVDAVSREQGVPYEGNLAGPVKQHIFHVTRRWMDPNGDGDPSDGIDGFRLDAAEQVPMGFWRDYRKYVRSINEEAVLIGEIWWKEQPEEMMDPRPYVAGDVFDAVMHYQWYKPSRQLFANANGGMTPSAFAAAMDAVYADYDPNVARAMMNLIASHDSPRFATSFYNSGPYKKDCSPRENASYKIDRPDELTQRRQRLMLTYQFTFLSAPHVWNGDEAAMWGADGPDTRKPLLWAGKRYQYDSENTHPTGKKRPLNHIKGPDQEFRDTYKWLASLRKKQPALVYGDLEWVLTDDENQLLAYKRSFEGEEVLVIFSLADEVRTVELPNGGRHFHRVFSYRGISELLESTVKLQFDPLGVVVLSTLKT